jgi:hypothetical protein
MGASDYVRVASGMAAIFPHPGGLRKVNGKTQKILGGPGSPTRSQAAPGAPGGPLKSQELREGPWRP